MHPRLFSVLACQPLAMNLYDNSILDPQFFVSIEEPTPGPELAGVVSEVLAAD
jgi:hypothetical protein